MSEKQEYHGRLELTWTNKDRTLLTSEDDTYEWVNPSDYRVAEVRLLTEVAAVGETGPHRAADNLLIRGDALHGLQSLNRLPEFADEYQGKVRLCYIDPPFNTGQAFAQYDDNLEHSVWLTMLRDRLVQIKPLLADNGSVWVHLDDAEVHRCRVVMDEVFGAGAFVTSIAWQKKTSRDNRAAFSSTHDTILVYSPAGTAWKDSRNRLEDLGAYSNPDNDPLGEWRSVPMSAPAGHSTAAQFYEITTPTGVVHTPPGGRAWTYTQPRFHELQQAGKVYWPKGGDGKPRLKMYPADSEGLVPFSMWTASEVGVNDDAKRHVMAMFPGLDPFATPKPEELLQRVIHIATCPGEIVLDCFAGSGTTAAVAHKMGRRWVTMERSAETVATFTMPRLAKVVAGEDPGGITSVETPTGEGLPDGLNPGEAKTAAKALNAFLKADALDDVEGLDEKTVQALIKTLRAAEKTTVETIWAGGGGFRVLDVGPSMFTEVAGRVYLADWATDSALAEAIAAQYGFEYEPDGPFAGRKGRMRLAVVDGLVNDAVIDLILSALPEGEKVSICGTAIDPAARAVLKFQRPGSTLKKVPASLLDEYRQSRRERLRMAARLDNPEATDVVDH